VPPPTPLLRGGKLNGGLRGPASGQACRATPGYKHGISAFWSSPCRCSSTFPLRLTPIPPRWGLRSWIGRGVGTTSLSALSSATRHHPRLQISWSHAIRCLAALSGLPEPFSHALLCHSYAAVLCSTPMAVSCQRPGERPFVEHQTGCSGSHLSRLCPCRTATSPSGWSFTCARASSTSSSSTTTLRPKSTGTSSSRNPPLLHACRTQTSDSATITVASRSVCEIGEFLSNQKRFSLFIKFVADGILSARFLWPFCWSPKSPVFDKPPKRLARALSRYPENLEKL